MFCYVFFQAKWISEVNLKSGSEDKTAAGHDPQIPQVYFCLFYQCEKTWLTQCFYVFIYCWAAWCVSEFILKSMQPPHCTIPTLPSIQAFVTLTFDSSWTNCCLACYLSSDYFHHGLPEPFNLHCNYFNDLPACLYANVRMGLETGMSDIFEISYLTMK